MTCSMTLNFVVNISVFLHRARISTATGLQLTALSVALPPLVAQAKTAASAHQEREEKSERPFQRMAYAQRRTLRAYALLTAQGFFFRAEVPASTPLCLSVVLFAYKTCKVTGQCDVFGLLRRLFQNYCMIGRDLRDFTHLCLQARFTAALSSNGFSST